VICYSTPMEDAPARLVARGIGKSFGTTRALEGVSFELRPGRVHAIIGENGAGKSTLMRIVAGAERSDTGSLVLDGVDYAPLGPLEARQHGVAIVYQELSVCPDLTVSENIVLGAESSRFGWSLERKNDERVLRALAPITRARGDLPLDARVGGLSAAEQQLVEIGRALATENPRVLILDEPTSSLGSDDVDRLFGALARLRDSGLAILYISHFLEEVRRIADDYTVLRDGKTVASGLVADVTNDALVAAMAGRRVEGAARIARERGDAVLTVRDLGGERLPRRASFTLHRGEVLGVAGLVGSGRTELLRAIFGLDKVRSGQVTVRAFSGAASPHRRLAQGVGMLSEDRKNEGLAGALSVRENLTLSKLGPLRRRGLLSPSAERKESERFIARLGIRCRDADQNVGELSGGNQQKVALARLLYHDVDVLLLDEPTRGIDVRSRAEVHGLVGELAAQGKAVLVVSSQLPELLALCDRIAVMHRGVLGEARPSTERDEHALLSEAAGA
jgi:ribose transport system ATP-binding protein